MGGRGQVEMAAYSLHRQHGGQAQNELQGPPSVIFPSLAILNYKFSKNHCTTPCVCPSRTIPSPNIFMYSHFFPSDISLSFQPSESICRAQTICTTDSYVWPPPVTTGAFFHIYKLALPSRSSNYIAGMLCTSRVETCSSLCLD